MGKQRKKDELKPVTCRNCGLGPYVPSFTFDFYQDDVDGPGTGLCESCLMSGIGVSIDKPVLIEKERVDSVCGLKKGGSTVCRYLVCDGAFKCAKGTGMQAGIDARVGTMAATGDNCSGSPDFTVICRPSRK